MLDVHFTSPLPVGAGLVPARISGQPQGLPLRRQPTARPCDWQCIYRNRHLVGHLGRARRIGDESVAAYIGIRHSLELTTSSGTKSSSATHCPIIRSRDQTRMSRPWSAGLQTQEGSPSCGTVSGQDLHSRRFLGLHYALCIEFSNTLLGKAHFLEYLPRVLAQQWSRSAWHDQGIPKTDIVPRQP